MPDWVATLICPDDDFAGAPLLRCEFTLDNGHGPVMGPRCTRRRTGCSRPTSTATGSPTTCSVPVGAATSGGCATRATTLPASAATDVRARHRPGQRLVSRPAGVGRRPRLLRRGAGRLRAAGDRVQRRPRADRGHRRVLDRRPLSRRGQRPLRRPDDRRSEARSDDWLLPGFSDPSWTGRAFRRARPGHADSLHWTARAPPGGAGAGRIWTSPSGRTLVDFGQNLVGLGQRPGPGPGRHRGHAAARRGAGARRARRTTAAYGQGHGPVRPQRWGGRVRAHLHLPRLPLCRGRRMARGARPRTP